MFPYDFRHQKMMNQYRRITTKCLNINLNLKDCIISITSNLLINVSTSGSCEIQIEKS